MLPLVPELDGWIYETTRDGRWRRAQWWSAMCLCATCGNMLGCSPALGMTSSVERHLSMITTDYKSTLHNQLQVDNRQRYSSKIYLKCLEFCKSVDPENPICQVTGKYQLRLDSQPGVPPRWQNFIYHVTTLQHCRCVCLVLSGLSVLHCRTYIDIIYFRNTETINVTECQKPVLGG